MSTYKEFAGQIKEKYPDYQNVDDRKLAQDVVAKYPYYADKVSFEEPGPSVLDRMGTSIMPYVDKARGAVAPYVGSGIPDKGTPTERTAEFLNTPAVRFSNLAPPVDPKFYPVLAGLQAPGRALLKGAESLTTPMNAGLAGLLGVLSPAAQRAASGALTYQMGKEAIGDSRKVAQDFSAGNYPGAIESGVGIGLNGLLALAAGKHAVMGETPSLGGVRAPSAEERTSMMMEGGAPPVPPERQLQDLSIRTPAPFPMPSQPLGLPLPESVSLGTPPLPRPTGPVPVQERWSDALTEKINQGEFGSLLDRFLPPQEPAPRAPQPPPLPAIDEQGLAVFRRTMQEKAGAAKPWSSEAGAVINPGDAILRIAELAKGSDSYKSFREAIVNDRDLLDTARFHRLNLQSIYQNRGTDSENVSRGTSPLPQLPTPGGGELSSPPPLSAGTPSFVDEKALTLNVSDNPKATARDIRESYSGAKNAQIVRTNQLAQAINKIVPDKVQRQGLTFLVDTGGDTQKIQEAMKTGISDEYRPALEAALNPTPQMQRAKTLLDQYYAETGKVGKDYGFLPTLRDNYINRIYKQETEGQYPKTEVNRSGLPKTTAHAKGRTFDTLLDAIKAGKKPATLDSTDLLTIHGAEFAKTLTNNKLIQGLKSTGLGVEAQEGKLPAGYQRIGNSNLAVPDWLSTGIRAITEPNFIRKVDELGKLNKYQGLVKTVELSVSLFHHFTMAMQALYQTKGGTELPAFTKFAKSADFNKLEQDFAGNTGMVSNLDANKDVLRKISQGNDFLSKASQLPVVKPVFEALEKNNNFLFGKMQRWLKVMDYGKKVSDWVGKNPEATNEQVTSAKRGFAQEVNAAYGGLNWEEMGVSPSLQALGRLLFLAPDWTVSNVALLKYAGQGGAKGSAARSHLISAAVTGAVLTEGLNKLLTGHYTDQNKKGHEFEVEVRPDTYTSFFRGGIGDGLKWASNMKESGILEGSARFTQGKASPLARTAVGLLANSDYLGRRITNKKDSFAKKSASEARFLASSLAPVPFGLSAVSDLAGKGSQDPASYALVASGLARAGYNKNSKKRANWLP